MGLEIDLGTTESSFDVGSIGVFSVRNDLKRVSSQKENTLES